MNNKTEQRLFTRVDYPAAQDTVLAVIEQDLVCKIPLKENDSLFTTFFLATANIHAHDPIVFRDGQWGAVGHELLWEFVDRCILQSFPWQEWRVELSNRYDQKEQ